MANTKEKEFFNFNKFLLDLNNTLEKVDGLLLTKFKREGNGFLQGEVVLDKKSAFLLYLENGFGDLNDVVEIFRKLKNKFSDLLKIADTTKKGYIIVYEKYDNIIALYEVDLKKILPLYNIFLTSKHKSRVESWIRSKRVFKLIKIFDNEEKAKEFNYDDLIEELITVLN